MDYQNVIEVLDFENVKKIVPFTVAEIKSALESGDKYLNTLPIERWDNAAGFHQNTRTGNIIRFGSPLMEMLNKKGIHYSYSQLVCILKECARMMAEGK